MANVIIKPESGDINKEENIRLWQNRIQGHLKWVKEYWNGWGSWKAAYLLDRAIHWGEAKAIAEKSQSLDSKVTIPLIATHVRNLIPYLFSTDPEFYGSPQSENEEDITSAIAQIDYLNHVWREQRMSKQAKRSILDAAIIGHGIGKTGWGYDTEIPKTDDPGKKGEINYLNYIQSESPYIRRINPFMFIFDRTSPDSDLASARWCAEFVIQTVQDLIDNDLYNKKLRKKVMSGQVPIMKVREFNAKYHEEGAGEDDLSFLFKGKESEKIEIESPDVLCLVYKVYDRKFGNSFTLIPGYNEEALEITPWDEYYSHLENFPFVKLDFEEVPNEIFGVGHARYLADIQHQLNRNRSKIFAITRAFNPKYVYKGSKPLSITQKSLIKSDQFGEVIDIPQDGKIEAFPTPQASQDLYHAGGILDKDYSELSGDDILTRGGLLPSRTSAEEIRERSRLRGLRLETNVQNSHEFVLDLARQVLAHGKRFATQDKVVDVTGRPGATWNKVSVAELKKTQVTLKMELISKPSEPPEVRRRQLFELFQIIANPNIYQLLQSQGVQVNMKRLWNEIIKTYDIDPLVHVFPGLDNSLPEIDLSNPASQQGFGDQNSTDNIRQDNVSEASFGQGMQGIQGILGGLGGGG